MKRNAPVRRDEGAVCRCGGDKSASSTTHAQIQYLAARLGLSIHRAALIAPIAFGVIGNA